MMRNRWLIFGSAIVLSLSAHFADVYGLIPLGRLADIITVATSIIAIISFVYPNNEFASSSNISAIANLTNSPIMKFFLLLVLLVIILLVTVIVAILIGSWVQQVIQPEIRLRIEEINFEENLLNSLGSEENNTSLSTHIFKIKNVGGRDINTIDFITPIKFIFPEEAIVTDVLVIDSEPASITPDVKWQIETQNVLSIIPLRLRSQDSLTIKAVVKRFEIGSNEIPFDVEAPIAVPDSPEIVYAHRPARILVPVTWNFLLGLTFLMFASYFRRLRTQVETNFRDKDISHKNYRTIVFHLAMQLTTSILMSIFLAFALDQFFFNGRMILRTAIDLGNVFAIRFSI